jgi:hypothetical protein
METVKSKIFNYLTKSQKSDICHYISIFVKTRYGKGEDEILAEFIEEERYYLEIVASRHPWIIDYLDDPGFYKDVSMYISENQRKYQYKEAQKPYIEKQKEYQKEQRKIARDRKMQRERPTPKQISYYKALCKKYDIEISSIDLENASKFDLRNAIDTLLTEQHTTDKQKILSRLNEIIKARQIEE